jgi:adenylate cyclase
LSSAGEVVPEGRRQLAAIMFTDLAGYTALTQSNESLAMEVLERHNRLLRPFFPKFHGREVKAIGDSFLVEFESALDALRCAVEIQSYLHDYNVSSQDEWKIRLRIGIHLGDVIHRASDVFGDAVNIASRMQPISEPEGVCVSEQVFDQVRNKIPQPLVKLSQLDLKNIQFPIDVYKVVMPWEQSTLPIEATSLSPSRIAVLPFANFSPDPNDEYFADGMTDEIISTVSKISGLSVISRTSVMRYKQTPKATTEIGRELKASKLLEGSVRKSGSRIRITVQLIDTKNDDHLWAESYDRNMEDIFEVQSDIAENVADALKMRLLDQEKQQIEKKPTRNIGAYTLYLKGRYYWNERNKESLEKAIKYFEEAVKRDPEFALAYSGLADSYIVLVDHGYLTRSEGYANAREEATKALELDDTLAEPHTSLANILSVEWDWTRAEEEFAKALKANPNYATAHHWYSIHLATLGRLDEAVRELKIAEELDPLSPMIHSYGALGVYLPARQYDTALTELDKALELDPDFVPAHANRVWIYLAKSMFDEALAEQERVLPFFEPLSTTTRARVGAVYAITGRIEEAKRMLQKCEQAFAHERADVDHSALSHIYWKLGDKNRAFEMLEEAIKFRTITPFQLKLDPFFDELASDPRFDELVKKTGVGELLPGRNLKGR